jgi:hypothetical protein
MVQDEVAFYGHPNITSLHRKTIEITKDTNITPNGDCIIGVRANKACSDLDKRLQVLLKEDKSLIIIELIVENIVFRMTGYSNKKLSLHSKHDIVTRRSNFVCPRTLLVECDKASYDIPREIIQLLKNPKTKGLFIITGE